MATCEKCAGKGLTGNGPQPWLMQGHVTTCSDCGGTGVKPEISTDEAQEVVPKKNRSIIDVLMGR